MRKKQQAGYAWIPVRCFNAEDMLHGIQGTFLTAVMCKVGTKRAPHKVRVTSKGELVRQKTSTEASHNRSYQFARYRSTSI